MEILVVQIFVSLLLVVGGVLALAYSVKQADHEHADRLSILPLEDDEPNNLPLVADERSKQRDHRGAA
jgi:nitrogen fixation-related uncharacterized protein